MQAYAAFFRRTALVIAWLVTTAGLLFAVGYGFEDSESWTGVALTAGLLLALIGLTALAWRASRAAFLALTTAVALVAGWAVVDGVVEIVDLPVVPVIAVVLAVPIAVLGQREPMRAGWLLLALSAVPSAVVLARLIEESGGERPGIAELLTTSTGTVIVPLVVIAALLLAAGSLSRLDSRHAARSTQPPAVMPGPPR